MFGWSELEKASWNEFMDLTRVPLCGSVVGAAAFFWLAVFNPALLFCAGLALTAAGGIVARRHPPVGWGAFVAAYTLNAAVLAERAGWAEALSATSVEFLHFLFWLTLTATAYAACYKGAYAIAAVIFCFFGFRVQALYPTAGLITALAPMALPCLEPLGARWYQDEWERGRERSELWFNALLMTSILGVAVLRRWLGARFG